MELLFKNNINESINIKENKTINKTVLFTDMVESSKAWKNHTDKMIDAIELQSRVIDKYCKKHKGLICKTIGDAYMLVFDDPLDSIKCAIEIQENLKADPIKISKSQNVILRIGICYGPVYESKVDVQNIKLIDYFGNTVNTASRIESKVCDPGNIAFGLASSDIDEIDLKPVLDDRKVELISFTNKGDEVKRSNRILNEIHRHVYKNIKELKGVENIEVFKITI